MMFRDKDCPPFVIGRGIFPKPAGIEYVLNPAQALHVIIHKHRLTVSSIAAKKLTANMP